MAKTAVTNAANTMTATADTTNLVDSTYPFALLGGSATQRSNILEVYLGGQMTASAIAITLLSRDSQIATGALTSDATLMQTPIDVHTAALAAPLLQFNKAATNKPQRDVAKHLLTLSFNAFGGIVRWVAAPGEEISMYGTAASVGQVSLSAFTGSTASTIVGSHAIVETF